MGDGIVNSKIDACACALVSMGRWKTDVELKWPWQLDGHGQSVLSQSIKKNVLTEKSADNTGRQEKNNGGARPTVEVREDGCVLSSKGE